MKCMGPGGMPPIMGGGGITRMTRSSLNRRSRSGIGCAMATSDMPDATLDSRTRFHEFSGVLISAFLSIIAGDACAQRAGTTTQVDAVDMARIDLLRRERRRDGGRAGGVERKRIRAAILLLVGRAG